MKHKKLNLKIDDSLFQMSTKDVIFYSVVGLICTTLLYVFYMPYYYQRVDTLASHKIFLETGHCPEISKNYGYMSMADILNKVNPGLGDKMRYVFYDRVNVRGSRTNCKIADSYMKTPVWLGAVSDMWYDSIIYSTLTAQSLYSQVVYGMAFIAFVMLIAYKGVDNFFKFIALRAVLNKKENDEVEDEYKECKRYKAKKNKYVSDEEESENEDEITEPDSREPEKFNLHVAEDNKYHLKNNLKTFLIENEQKYSII